MSMIPALPTRLSKAGWRKQPTIRNKLPTGMTQYTLIWTHPDGRTLQQRDNVAVDGKVHSKTTMVIEAIGTTSISLVTDTLTRADAILHGQYKI
jgi:hypothetical protein